MTLSIRLKLALLAGVPVIGAAILSARLVTQAQERVRLAKSLGSIENLVELSERTTNLIHGLEGERTALCLATGYRSANAQGKVRTQDGAENAAQQARLAMARTDDSLRLLNEFLAERNESALPKKLANAIRDAKNQLVEIHRVRAQLDQVSPNWEALTAYYAQLIRALTGTVSGLTELSNDGDLLRKFNALVAILELEAQASTEHAMVAHALAVGEFPPGSFRAILTAITAQELYQDVFETIATYQTKQQLDQSMPRASLEPVKRLRAKWLNVADDDLDGSPEEWLIAGQTRLLQMEKFERLLHADGKSLAAEKLYKTRQDVWISTTLAGTIVLFSLAFAAVLAVGLTRRLSRMRQVVEQVGDGDLAVRVDASQRDELGSLGEAFNQMVGEISESRLALGEQARMARDLEIATEIQRAMVPKTPSHPEFEFAGNMIPADEVGGDFYDVLTDGKALWLTVGDVCGHGIGSGLVMLMTQVAFASNFLHDSDAEPAQVWRRVNRLLCENIKNRLEDDRYVTAQLLNHRGDGRFSCVGAHQWPIVYRQATGRCEIHESIGPWLGIDPDQSDVPASEILLQPGDVLCLYSDGLPESQDNAGELFDVQRMQQTLEQSLQRNCPMPQVVVELFAAVEQFSGRRDDDWTLLLVRRKSAESVLVKC